MSDQFPPFERRIADYRRLAREPERFEELTEVLFALYEVAPEYREDELRSITVPVLVLAGAEEELVKPEHTRQSAALIPGATLIVMAGTGHFALFAQPAVFNQIVLDSLAGKALSVPPTQPAAKDIESRAPRIVLERRISRSLTLPPSRKHDGRRGQVPTWKGRAVYSLLRRRMPPFSTRCSLLRRAAHSLWPPC